ncbi:MAG: STT3 domain-containing protein [Fervidicoccaceae archaeon]
MSRSRAARLKRGRRAGRSSTWLSARSKHLAIAAVTLATMVGAYLRLIPALKHGLDLHEADPYLAYWIAQYLVEHGIASLRELTPDNPATHVFWYPWGRDLYHGEYPLMSIVAASLYPLAQVLGLSLKQLVALIPVLSGAAAIPVGYLLARAAAGELAGIAAAFFLAVTPGALERTISGFAEKTGFAAPLILAYLYLLLEALRRRSLTRAVGAGVLCGLIAWSWGGWQAFQLVAAAIFVFYPLVGEPDRRISRLSIAFAASAAIVSLSSPALFPRDELRGPVGLMLVSSLAPAFYSGLGRVLKGAESRTVKLVYAALLAALLLAALLGVLKGYVHISGRVLYLAGLAGPGDPLSASVAEHRTLPYNYVFREVGGAWLLSSVFLLYGVFACRRRPELLTLLVPTVVMLFLAFRSAYLMQTVATVLSASAGAALGLLSPLTSRVLSSREPDSLAAAGIGLVLMVLAALLAIHAKTAYATASSTVPLIRAGGAGLTVENRAWLYALDYVRENTDPGSVVVAWWDYGYWISVYGQRASVADGSTFNGTQIELLARALTASDEKEAVDIIFDDFRAPPNNTYLLFFEVLRSSSYGEIRLTGPVISLGTATVGMGDVPKSVWMLRIAGRLGTNEFAPYFTARPVPTQGGGQAYVAVPAWENETVRSVLLYRLLINGVSELGQKYTGGCANLTGVHQFIDWSSLYTGQPIALSAEPLEHFELEKVFVDCIYETSTDAAFVAVFLYKVKP